VPSGLSSFATFGDLFGSAPRQSTPVPLGLSDIAAISSLLRGDSYQPGYFEALEKAKTELTDPIDFMCRNYPGQALWRFVLTHPDLDHMRGIKCLYETIGFHNFWDTAHTKKLSEFRSDADREDWQFYQQLRNGTFGSYPKLYTRGAQQYAFARDEYGNPGGDGIEILSPTPDLVRSCNTAQKSNDLSLVLRLWHAGKSVLLPGDAEEEAWDNMVSFYGNYLKSDFLKASHHGRDSGYHLAAVQRIAPSLTFVSVGQKPNTDASNKYRQQCLRVASTRYHGNIKLEIYDDGQFKWFVDRNA
jgi:beta-lactamase superfamily II metal-dependent hydrolase